MDSNSTSGSPSGDELPSHSISTARSSQNLSENDNTPPSPPPVARRLLPANGSDHQRSIMPASSFSSASSDHKQHTVSALLSSNVQSPDSSAADDDLYLPHPSSSFSEENYLPSSNLATPVRKQHENFSNVGAIMQQRGSSIETPGPNNFRASRDDDGPLVFPHPLRKRTESPQVEVTRHVNLSHSISESQEGIDDEDAFLPDDFKHEANTYTWEQVQEFVRDAEKALESKLQEHHQRALEELQETMEQHLQEHGAEWKRDSEEEYARLQALLREEKSKTQLKHRELLNKVTAIADLENQLAIATEHKRHLEARVQALEEQMEEDTTANDQAKELYLRQLHQQIQELQVELSETRRTTDSGTADKEYILSLERAKEKAEKKVKELESLVLLSQNQVKTLELNRSASSQDSNKLDMERASYENKISELQATNAAANQQIVELQAQLEDYRQQIDSSNMEELILLKSQKAAAERKLNDLQQQLGSRKNAKDDRSQVQLKEAYEKIESLQQLLLEAKERAANASFSSEVSHEEFFAAKTEAETLRVLREDDLKEKSEMRHRIQEMQHEINLSQHRRKGRDRKLEIDTLQVELLPTSTRNESFSQDEETVVMLRKELEELRSELSELRKQQGENKFTPDSREVEQARQELETQIQELKQKLDETMKNHEAEKRALQADLSVQEIEELTSEVEILKKRHKDELESQRRTIVSEHESALAIATQRLKEVQRKFQEEIALLVDSHAQEKKSLQADIAQLKTQFEQELVTAQTKSKEASLAEINELQQKLEQLRIEFEDEKIEIIRASSEQADELQTKLSLQQQTHDEELELKHEQIQALEREITVLQQAAVSKEQAATLNQESIDNLKNEMESVKTKSKNDIDALEKKLTESLNENTNLKTKIADLESKQAALVVSHRKDVEEATRKAKAEMECELKTLEATVKAMEADDGALTGRIAELKSRTEADRAEYTRRIQQVREEHTKEIDDLLNQLDLVEAEHNEKYSAKQKLVKEKEAVISALGAQLAEAELRLTNANQTKENFSKQVEELKEELEEVKAEKESKVKEIQKLVAEHQLALKEEEALRERLCDEAREEMIQRAEVQFENANAMYKKLKQEFDAAQSNIAKLEKELKVAKKQASEIRKEKEARELELAEELTQAKAAIAAGDLNATRKAKQYRNDLDRSKQSEQELRNELEEAVATSRSVQRTLASVFDEKEKLIKENKDLKAVCEELMELVEGTGAGAK